MLLSPPSIRPVAPLICLAVAGLAPACTPAPDPDAGPEPCAEPTDGPTEHQGTIYDDETWTAATGPHRITFDFSVAADATLRIEPCARVEIDADRYFYVYGDLVAEGTADHRITITSSVATERFASIHIRAPGSARLRAVDVSRGGARPNSTLGATFNVEGAGFPPARPLFVDDVTVADSAGYGVYLRSWAGFADGSTNLTISDVGREATEYPYPIRVTTNAIGTIPPGDYTGNQIDAIQIISESPHYDVEIDDVIRDRGVPYVVGGNGGFALINVRGTSGLATLTIEPGVTLRFGGDTANIGGMHIGGSGEANASAALVAVGTAARQVVLTTDRPAPAAGAWEGVNFVGVLSPASRLEQVRIEYAGAHGGDSGFGCLPAGEFASDAALKIFAEAASSLVTATTIADSSAHGILEGWTGAEVDFVTDNQFDRVAGCRQISPRPTTGTCPDPVSCP